MRDDEHTADRPHEPESETTPETERGGLSRRRFLKASGATVAAVGGGLAATGTASAESGTARVLAPKPGSGLLPELAEPGAGHSTATQPTLTTTPIRPPAVPLIVRQPYLSTWLGATTLPGTWETFWTGSTTALGGILRVDGASYQFAGDPTISLQVPDGGHPPQTATMDFEAALDQSQLEVTATRSIFTLLGGGVELTVEFLSPVEPGDLRRQSVPMGYVLTRAQSVDGNSHDVSVYLDVSGEWLAADPTQRITWSPATVPYAGGSLQTWSVQLTNQQTLTETSDMANWGTLVFATPSSSALTWQSGASPEVRARFVHDGALANANLTPTSAINGNSYPVFAFAQSLGTVGSSAVAAQFSIGHVRTPAIDFLGSQLQPLWTQYWPTWKQMLGDFHADAAGAEQRAQALDAKIEQEATELGGTEYAALCALGLRQAYGGTELVVGTDGTPWAFVKEISSDGDTSTVDILYPAFPVWAYLDPPFLSLTLKPLFAYAASGKFTKPYAPHDLGHYPQAIGYPPLPPGKGGEEAMPVEESGNMLIMAAAYAQGAPGAASQAYLNQYYGTLKGWATYLTQNLPDPGFQNQTDDFAGPIANSVNLALKGIIGVAAMSQIATAVGNAADAAQFGGQARSFMQTWLSRAQDPSGKHLDLTYNGAGDGNGTWGTTYNGFADTLLGTGLIPDQVRAEQAAFYPTVMNMFGLPLQRPHSYAKSDWEIWLAAWLADYPVSGELISRVYLYANTTETRVPFSDLYSTISGRQVGFQARPVQGGMFALLAQQALAAARNGRGAAARRSRRRHATRGGRDHHA